MKIKRFWVKDLQNAGFLEGVAWTEQEIIDHMKAITKDEGASDLNYSEHKEFIDSDKFNLDFIARFWEVEIIECQHSKKARVVVSEILKDITKVFCLQFTRKERQFYMNQYELLPEYLEESVKRQRIYNLILLNSRGK